MKTLTIKNLVIQVDSKSKSVKEVKKIVDLINTTLQEAELNCQPQLMFGDNFKIEKTITESTFDLREDVLCDKKKSKKK